MLKEAYFCLKLNGTTDKIREIEPRVDENMLADWEYEIVSKIIKVRKDEIMKEYEDVFLMGSSHIKENIELNKE